MRCKLIGFCLLQTILLAELAAQPWAEKMFTSTEHDFGTLARGAKAEFEFELENLYEEDVHIAGVRSSCGCTEVKISKPTLKTFEKGFIVADFNTRSYLGHKSATLTVSIDRPFPAEVQLNVRGFIRRDVVLKPGAVKFGDVMLGETAQRTLQIEYAGRTDWKLLDVRSDGSYFHGALKELNRSDGKVSYALTIRLKPDAAVGYINDQLILVTNDRRDEKIPVSVTGRIVGPVTVSPAALTLGILKPGETITKKLVVRGKRPFRITSFNCSDDSFRFNPSDSLKKVHLVPVSFTADNNLGTIKETIQIETDLAPGANATCVATATIRK